MAEEKLNTFEMNPAMWLGALGAFLALLVSFGVSLTGDQVGAIQDFAEKILPALVPLLIGYLTKRQVFPVAKVEAAVGATRARDIANTTTKPAA